MAVVELIHVMTDSLISEFKSNLSTMSFSNRYNVSDTPRQITWIRQSFLFMGTGGATSLLFESMSEKYGPVIDNVVILSGVHILHSNFAPSVIPLWQLMYSIFIVVALIVYI